MINDFSKLDDLVWGEFTRLSENADIQDAFRIWDENLEKIGVKSFTVHYNEDQHQAICEIIKIAQQNPDSVLVTGGSSGWGPEDGRDFVYAFPRELAERMIVLGAMPGLP